MVSRCFQIQWGIFRKRGRAIAARIPLNCNFRRPPWEFAESRNRHQLHSPVASSANVHIRSWILGNGFNGFMVCVRTNFFGSKIIPGKMPWYMVSYLNLTCHDASLCHTCCTRSAISLRMTLLCASAHSSPKLTIPTKCWMVLTLLFLMCLRIPRCNARSLCKE